MCFVDFFWCIKPQIGPIRDYQQIFQRPSISTFESRTAYIALIHAALHIYRLRYAVLFICTVANTPVYARTVVHTQTVFCDSCYIHLQAQPKKYVTLANVVLLHPRVERERNQQCARVADEIFEMCSTLFILVQHCIHCTLLPSIVLNF